jgi:hypothetical protein
MRKPRAHGSNSRGAGPFMTILKKVVERTEREDRLGLGAGVTRSALPQQTTGLKMADRQHRPAEKSRQLFLDLDRGTLVPPFIDDERFVVAIGCFAGLDSHSVVDKIAAAAGAPSGR